MQQTKLFNLLKWTNIWFKIEIHDTEFPHCSTWSILAIFDLFAEFFGLIGHF